MTVSLPATLPTPAPAGKNHAPAKGLATAPGQSTGAESVTAEAAGVADMFAALVAALTAQMQPTATDAATGEIAGETPAAGTGPAVVDLAAVIAEAVPADAGEVPADAVVAADDMPIADAAPADIKGATPAQPAIPGERSAIPATPGNGASGDKAAAATPATPATPATHGTRGERAVPATPATPAQPQHSAAVDAAAALVGGTPTTPTATVEGDTADTATPAVPATPATSTTSNVERTAPAAPVVRATPADPHVQVARVVRPLRLGNDGAYELALDLTPAELGRVRIDVELRGSTIHLSLRADNPATRDLLSSSLSQLRSELEAAGLQAGHLDVGGQSAGRGAPDPRTAPAETVATTTTLDEPDVMNPATDDPDAADADGVNVLA